MIKPISVLLFFLSFFFNKPRFYRKQLLITLWPNKQAGSTDTELGHKLAKWGKRSKIQLNIAFTFFLIIFFFWRKTKLQSNCNQSRYKQCEKEYIPKIIRHYKAQNSPKASVRLRNKPLKSVCVFPPGLDGFQKPLWKNTRLFNFSRFMRGNRVNWCNLAVKQ